MAGETQSARSAPPCQQPSTPVGAGRFTNHRPPRPKPCGVCRALANRASVRCMQTGGSAQARADTAQRHNPPRGPPDLTDKRPLRRGVRTSRHAESRPADEGRAAGQLQQTFCSPHFIQVNAEEEKGTTGSSVQLYTPTTKRKLTKYSNFTHGAGYSFTLILHIPIIYSFK